MTLSAFSQLLAATSFTRVGLWWVVVDKRPEWTSDPVRRGLAGGTYVSFLLPGLMATLAEISFQTPYLWRVSFALCALLGLWSTTGLLRLERSASGYLGPFRRFRWTVIAVYLSILTLGITPEFAGRR